MSLTRCWGTERCRLGIIQPEVYRMQAEAIFQAAVECVKEGITGGAGDHDPAGGACGGIETRCVPWWNKVAAEVMAAENVRALSIQVGTMIGVQRAALDGRPKLQKKPISSPFGTDEGTQTTFGYSRDDAEGKFLHTYVDQKILPDNPFIRLDREGVGEAGSHRRTEKEKHKASRLKTGICGEHQAEKKNTIRFLP